MDYKELLFEQCWNLSDKIFLLLSKQYIILDVNQRAEKILCYDRSELLHKNITQIFPDTRLSHIQAANNFLVTEHRQRQVTWRIVQLNVVDDGESDPPYLLMSGKVESLLAKDKKKLSLKDLIRYAPGMFYWKDNNIIYEGCNERFAEIAGLNSRFDVIGKSDNDLPWGMNASNYTGIDQQVLDSGKADLNREEIIRTVDGSDITLLTSKVPLFDNFNKVVGVLGISVDITQQKENEKNLKELNKKLYIESQVKTEFFSNISHDVKTPLSGIISLSESLRNTVSPSQREYISDIYNCAKSLMSFFNNVIELSKLDSSVNPSSRAEEDFDLRDLLDEIIILFQPGTTEKNLNLTLEYDETIPKLLYASRLSLYQILLNLTGNAIKFTETGSVKILAKLGKGSTSTKAMIEIIIADTGIGIPKDKQKAIFERFCKLTPSYQGTYEGSGIGLYIVKQLVEGMNGKIECRSDSDQGSEFIITLPLKIPTTDERRLQVSAAENNLIPPPLCASQLGVEVKPLESIFIPTPQPKILLVEDNIVSQKAANIVLQSCGCQVDIVDCGRRAIESFQSGIYAMAFIDIGLPDINGYQVAEKLRELEASTPYRTIILGLSAHTDKEDQQLSIDAGFDYMLSKPLLFDQADELLKQYVFK